MTNNISLGVTIGDSSGIGLEIFLGIIDYYLQNNISHNIILYGNKKSAIEYWQKLGIHTSIIEKTEQIVAFCDVSDYVPICFGKPDSNSSAMAASALHQSRADAYSKKIDAAITLPTSKIQLQNIGWKYPGQTEFYAEPALDVKPMMILCTEQHGGVRIALATIHIPVCEIPSHIAKASLQQRIYQLHDALRYNFGLAQHIKIAVLGLNPHAGEYGSIGSEEIREIIPAVRESTIENATVEGPFPADGFFAHGAYRNYHGILAMYHDQGLIPLKLLANGAGVNVTAGLPIIRTSPDHGTAYEIAGKNIADRRSAVEAFRLAAFMADIKRRQ